MDEMITDLLMQQQGQDASPQDMTPDMIGRRPQPPYGAWPQQSNPFEEFGRSMPPPSMQQPQPPMPQAPPPMFEADTPSGMGDARMSNIPRDVRGRMPLAPDTRERQFAAEVDEIMRLVQRAEAERMQREAEERQRAMEQDVPGPFPMPAFPVDQPKMHNI